MPRFPATKPPSTWGFQGLLEFRRGLKQGQPILLSVDFENIDHITEKGISPFKKMSELGIAIYDTRQPPAGQPLTRGSSATTGSNERLESLARSIVAEHVIIEEFRNKTELTCEAGYHRHVGHHARPYHCRFVDSTFLTQKETMDRLAEVIKSLSTQNLSEKEKEAGATRNIKIIVWAAHCEVETFYHGGLDLASLCPTLELWDFQIWYPFCARFHDKTEEVPRTGAERAFGSLGTLGSGLPLHNGCNDTVAQLLAFLRFMLMTEAEWSSWFDRKADLAPISFDWVDPAIYERNMALAPPPNPRVTAMYKGKGGKGKGKEKQGNRKTLAQTTIPEEPNFEAASSSYPGPEVLVDNMADLNIDLGPQSPVGNSTTSESSGTGWPEGIDSMSDWSPSSKPSSGDDNGSGWPEGIDDVVENDGHTGFEVTGRNGDAPANNVTGPAPWDLSRSGRRRNRCARRKRS